VANELGRTYVEQAVSSWRCGSSMPPADVLFALARQLNLSLDQFVLSRPTLDELLTALETQMADFTQPGDPGAREAVGERGGRASRSQGRPFPDGTAGWVPACSGPAACRVAARASR
jgi:transcriptional regulator with XRE-family HTH domain